MATDFVCCNLYVSKVKTTFLFELMRKFCVILNNKLPVIDETSQKWLIEQM
jgi:hypothetical protein